VVESRVSEEAEKTFVEKFSFFFTEGVQVYHPGAYLMLDSGVCDTWKARVTQTRREINQLGLV